MVSDLILTKLRRISPKEFDTVPTRKFFCNKSVHHRYCKNDNQFGNFKTSNGLISNLNTLERKSLACLTFLTPKRPPRTHRITYKHMEHINGHAITNPADDIDSQNSLHLYSLVKFNGLKVTFNSPIE